MEAVFLHLTLMCMEGRAAEQAAFPFLGSQKGERKHSSCHLILSREHIREGGAGHARGETLGVQGGLHALSCAV